MVTMRREMYEIPNHLQRLLSRAEAPILVVLSLSLQITLIFLGSMRKRTSSRLVSSILWLAYLSADAIAIYALGNISSNLGDDGYSSGSSSSSTSSYSGCLSPNDQLHAFWAPFLLLHLGGPDTITSLALEDNALWLRHGLTLVVQVVLEIYILLRSLPCTKLWLPSILMFLAGILKYGERTMALYCASIDAVKSAFIRMNHTAPLPGMKIKLLVFDRVEENPNPDYAVSMEQYASKPNTPLPTTVQEPEVLIQEQQILNPNPPVSMEIVSEQEPKAEPSQQVNRRKEMELLELAYNNFSILKYFIILDIKFDFQEMGKVVFSDLSSKQGFQVLEMMINFMSDTLFTKAYVVHTYWGRILHLFGTCFVISTSVLFSLANKKEYHQTDIAITYVLVYGAIALEFIGLVLFFSSDWAVVTLEDGKFWSWIEIHAYAILKHIPMARTRWANSMGQFNLLTFCLGVQQAQKTRFKKILAVCKLKEAFEIWQNTKEVPVSDHLKDFIWHYANNMVANDTKELHIAGMNTQAQLLRKRNEFLSTQAWLDVCLLILHIATELCYIYDTLRESQPSKPNLGGKEPERDKPLRFLSYLPAGKASLPSFSYHRSKDKNQNKNSVSEKQPRKTTKEISQYLLYIFLCQPSMLPPLTTDISTLRLQLSSVEGMSMTVLGDKSKNEGKALDVMSLANTDVYPQGLDDNSTLYDGHRMAEGLNKLGSKKWKVLSEMWIEMLFYFATQCNGNSHARRLSAGSELLTFVRLLTATLGLEKRYNAEVVYAKINSIFENAIS